MFYDGKFPNYTPGRSRDSACGLRFLSVQVLKTVPQQASRALARGSAYHAAKMLVFDPAVETPPGERDIEALTRRAFRRQPYEEAAHREADIQSAIGIIRAYVAQDADSGNTLAVEVFDSVTVSGGILRPLTLGAKFDRLIVRPEAPEYLVIRDYKTGAPAEVDLEGACIMLAVASLRFKEYRTCSVEFDFVGEGGLVLRQVVTKGDVKDVWPEVKARALRLYNATEFPAMPGEYCVHCPLRKQCQPDLEVGLDDLDGVFE